MSKEIKGNFEQALQVLISQLVAAKYTSDIAFKILRDWDKNRGNDWFTSTKLKEQNNKLREESNDGE